MTDYPKPPFKKQGQPVPGSQYSLYRNTPPLQPEKVNP
jgi:hypothetical protein